MKITPEKRAKAKQIKEKLAIRNLKAKTKKQFSRSKLIREADRVFSLYIRWRDQWKPCCTCGTAWQETFQCWHFMSRRHYYTRWIEYNAHAQCYRCNMLLSGEQYKHWKYLDEKYSGKFWKFPLMSEWLYDCAMKTEKTTDEDILVTIRNLYTKCFELGIDYKPKKQFIWNQTN